MSIQAEGTARPVSLRQEGSWHVEDHKVGSVAPAEWLRGKQWVREAGRENYIWLWQELCLHSEWDGEFLEHFEQRGDIIWHGFWPILKFLEQRSISSYLWGPLSVLEARTSPQHFWELALLQPFLLDVLGTPFLFHFSRIPTIKSPLFDFSPVGLYSSNWNRPQGQPLSLLWLPLLEKRPRVQQVIPCFSSGGGGTIPPGLFAMALLPELVSPQAV